MTSPEPRTNCAWCGRHVNDRTAYAAGKRIACCEKCAGYIRTEMPDDSPATPSSPPAELKGHPFFINEEWRCAEHSENDCSATLRCFKTDPDDEPVRVFTEAEYQALLALYDRQREEIERLQGDVAHIDDMARDQEATLDHFRKVEDALLSERDALSSQLERLTKEMAQREVEVAESLAAGGRVVARLKAEAEKVNLALANCGIGGIFDVFTDPADAITQMGAYIEELEGAKEPQRCGASNVEKQTVCMREAGHTGLHTATISRTVVTWDDWNDLPADAALRLRSLSDQTND